MTRDPDDLPAVLVRVASRVEACAECLDTCSAAVRGLTRVLLPVQMAMAQAEAAGEPLRDDEIAMSFMGSGASDRVTVGEVRASLAAADAALAQVQRLTRVLLQDRPGDAHRG